MERTIMARRLLVAGILSLGSVMLGRTDAQAAEPPIPTEIVRASEIRVRMLAFGVECPAGNALEGRRLLEQDRATLAAMFPAPSLAGKWEAFRPQIAAIPDAKPRNDGYLDKDWCEPAGEVANSIRKTLLQVEPRAGTYNHDAVVRLLRDQAREIVTKPLSAEKRRSELAALEGRMHVLDLVISKDRRRDLPEGWVGLKFGHMPNTKEAKSDILLAQQMVAARCAWPVPVSWSTPTLVSKLDRPTLEKILLEAPLESFFMFTPDTVAQTQIAGLRMKVAYRPDSTRPREHALSCYKGETARVGPYELGTNDVGLSCTTGADQFRKATAPLGSGIPGVFVSAELFGGHHLRGKFITADGELFELEYDNFGNEMGCIFSPVSGDLRPNAPMQHPVVVDLKGPAFEKETAVLSACLDRATKIFEKQYAANEVANITQSTRENRSAAIQEREHAADEQCRGAYMKKAAKIIEANERETLAWRREVYPKVLARLRQAGKIP